MAEVKQHPFFASVEWGLLESGLVTSPFIPNPKEIHAESPFDIGAFNFHGLKKVKIPDAQQKELQERFDYVNPRSLQQEVALVLREMELTDPIQNDILSASSPPPTIALNSNVHSSLPGPTHKDEPASSSSLAASSSPSSSLPTRNTSSQDGCLLM